MTLMDIFTHPTIVIQKAEAELRGIKPNEIKTYLGLTEKLLIHCVKEINRNK